MQKLAQYDPYAIEQIEFFVQKKTKYTSLKSILVTLVILTLTVILNFSAIEHLWLDRSELPVVSTSYKMSLQGMTSNYLCLFPKAVNSSLPRTSMINFDTRTGQIFKNYEITDKFKNNAEIVKVSNGRDSICYDMEGTVLTDFFYLRFLVYSTTGSQFDIMYKTYSAGELISNDKTNYVYLEGNVAHTNFVKLTYQVKKISAVYYDKLLIDYEPEKILGFSTRMDFAIEGSTLPENASHVDFFSEYVYPFDLTDQFTMTRYNIADILGRVLSWFSVFVLIFALGVSPILDYNYKVELAQKLYDNDKLNKIDISLLSYTKYLISKFNKNLFAESVLPTAFDQLQKDMDLLNLIKRQYMMKKLIKENETLNIEPKPVPTIISENDINMSELLIGDKELLSEDDGQYNGMVGMIRRFEESAECPLVTEPDAESRDGFITSVVKAMDIGEIEISLISNKGEGYKTSWNTIITVVFLCAVVWFIVFAGLFKLEPNYKLQTIPLLKDETIYPSITLNPADIIFRVNRTVSSTYRLSVVVVNRNDQIIQTVTLLNDTACDNYVTRLGETVGSGWQCLNSSIVLDNNGYNRKTKLGMRLVFTGFAFGTSYIEAKIGQYDIIDNQLKFNPLYIKNVYSANTLFAYNAQTILSQDQENGNSVNIMCNKFFSTSDSYFKGVSLELASEFTRIKRQVPSIWDVINNAWGIVVLAFSVFLSKVTRYLNVRQREKITQTEENQNRNDIVAIIYTQYKLVSRVFNEELKQVKYFYKTNFNDLSAKER